MNWSSNASVQTSTRGSRPCSIERSPGQSAAIARRPGARGHDAAAQAHAGPPLREPEPRPRHDARLLTAGGAEAEILLDGIRYVLRITRQGKLILTK